MPAPPRWTIARVIGHLLLVGVVFLAAQFVGVMILVMARTAVEPGFDVDAWMAQIEADGDALVAATWASTLVCVPFLVWLARRREGSPWKFLRLEPVTLKTCAIWSGGMIMLVVATDLLMMSLDQPVVPDFQLQWYESGSPLLFFLAIVVAAPLFEELFFRGYMMSAIERAGLPVFAGAVISAALWASIHVQYDAFYMSILFVMGLVLAAARAKTGSVVPCFAMHAAANAIAFAETALVAATR